MSAPSHMKATHTAREKHIRLNKALAVMTKDGGAFTAAIAEAAYNADPVNLKRLLDAFPALFERYADIAERTELVPADMKATPGDALPALPEPYGYLTEHPSGPRFQREPLGQWQDIAISTMPVYSYAEMQAYARASIAAAGALPEPLGYMSPEHVEHLRSREHLRGRNYNIKATVFLDHGLSATVPVFAAPSIEAPSPMLVEALRATLQRIADADPDKFPDGVDECLASVQGHARVALAAIKEQK